MFRMRAFLGCALSLICTASLCVPFPAQAKGEPKSSLTLEMHDGKLSISATNVETYAVAEAFQARTGIRIDGMEVLRTAGKTSIYLTDNPTHSLLTLFANMAGTSLWRFDARHYRFSTAQQEESLKRLKLAVEQAQDADPKALRKAEEALLDFIRPPKQGPVLVNLDPWFEAAARAAENGDHERVDTLVREGVMHLERIDKADSGWHGNLLFEVGSAFQRGGPWRAQRKAGNLRAAWAPSSNAWKKRTTGPR